MELVRAIVVLLVNDVTKLPIDGEFRDVGAVLSMPDVMLPSLTDGFTRDRVLPSEMAEDGQLVIEKPLSFRAAMPAETLAFETANDGLGALKRAARSFFGSVTKRWIGGGEDAFISLDDGHSC